MSSLLHLAFTFSFRGKVFIVGKREKICKGIWESQKKEMRGEEKLTQIVRAGGEEFAWWTDHVS